MGLFDVGCTIANPADRGRSVDVARLLVDTGSECTWVPAAMLDAIGVMREKTDRFVSANGQEFTRDVGFAVIRFDRFVTVDEVVFAEPGDPRLLGARTLEGMNLAVDPARKRLIAAGPRPAALATR